MPEGVALYCILSSEGAFFSEVWQLLSGGDLFEQKEKFFRFVESRNENTNFIIELIQNKTSFANRTAPVKKAVRLRRA